MILNRSSHSSSTKNFKEKLNNLFLPNQNITHPCINLSKINQIIQVYLEICNKNPNKAQYNLVLT